MAKSMTKSQIADHVASKAGLTEKAAVQLLDDFAPWHIGKRRMFCGARYR